MLGFPVGLDGVQRGSWKGVGFTVANNETREHEIAYRYSNIRALLEPPLGVEGVERNVFFDQIVDPSFRAEVAARARAIGMVDVSFGDAHIGGTFKERLFDLWGVEDARPSFMNPAVGNAAFELFVWAAQTIQARRAASPPPWERALAEGWPALARGWSMQLDVRRCEMAGVVRGRPTRARIVNRGGGLMTCVAVGVPLPPGCSLSLTRQIEKGYFDDLFASLVGGGDIEVGDPAFDAAFVVKGAPEAFVRDALTPEARAQLMDLATAGASLTFENGYLTAWARRALLTHEELDGFMKATFGAASAVGSPAAAPPHAPYR